MLIWPDLAAGHGVIQQTADDTEALPIMMLNRYFSIQLPRFILSAIVTLILANASMAVDSSHPNAVPAPQATDTSHDTERNTSASLHEINLLSAGLIQKAAAGNSPAHQFRIEARIYRELLRQLMLDNRALPGDEQIQQNLLVEMVRMSALLHAAADCKTGLVITCPPDLMRQLKSQQATIDAELTLNRPHQK